MTQPYLEITGLGGALDGYDVEHSGTCDAGFTYEIKKIIVVEDINLTEEYISTFKPKAFFKTWAR